MSRKAYILTKEDVPQYIRAIVQRLQPVLMEYSDEDGDWWGYTFRLNTEEEVSLLLGIVLVGPP